MGKGLGRGSGARATFVDRGHVKRVRGDRRAAVGLTLRGAEYSNYVPGREDSIRKAYAEGKAGSLPPIRLSVVGSKVDIIDGNHRVRVAREMGRRTIPAIVEVYDAAGKKLRYYGPAEVGL